MPTYRFLNHETGEEWEEFMGISAADEFLAENPNIERLVNGAPGLVSGSGDRTKPTNDFKEVMSRIADQNPYSPLADTYGKKDPTSVKLRETVKRVKKKVGSITE